MGQGASNFGFLHCVQPVKHFLQGVFPQRLSQSIERGHPGRKCFTGCTFARSGNIRITGSNELQEVMDEAPEPAAWVYVDCVIGTTPILGLTALFILI